MVELFLRLIGWLRTTFSAAGVPSLTNALQTGLVPLAVRRRRRTLIIGTGNRAQQLLLDMRQADISATYPVALLDLNGTHRNRTFAGVRVGGPLGELPAISKKLRAEFAVIALEPEEMFEMRRVVDQCIAGGLRCKTLPAESEVRESGVNLLRDITLEDLLSRPPVADIAPVPADLVDRVILVTGAAGAIGAELARQIAPSRPARLVLLDQAESDLYLLHLELSEAHPGLDVAAIICDITNATRLAQVYAQHRPDYVIHSAAYQHAPMMEANPREAVRNNVLGTLLVATTAVRYGAKKVLLLSTEDAARPANVVAATKRIAERIIFELPNLHRSGTDFRAVRFGNILPSRGNALALFERLAAGKPMGLYPPAECYFRARPEAAQLILRAGALPETSGAIASLELGEPCSLAEWAEKLMRISGREPGRSRSNSFHKQAPDQKDVEYVSATAETTVPTSSLGIRVSQQLERASPELGQKLSRLLAHLEDDDSRGLLRALEELVPRCMSPLSERREDPDSETEPPFNPRGAGAWQANLFMAEPSWRERRRSKVQFVPPADLHIAERRQGVECRRKDVRAGGRRRSDTAILLPAERASNIGGAPGEHGPACARSNPD